MKKTRPSPTILFLLTFIVGIFLSYLFPLYLNQYFYDSMTRVLGVLILSFSLIINILAYRKFKRFVTPYEPFTRPKVLIENGIFSVSRNPVYLALVLSQVGLGFIFNSVWILCMSIVLFILLHYLVVLDEERLLKKTFKETYTSYKEHTNRWF